MKQKQLVLEHVSKSANADINQNIPVIMYFFIIIIWKLENLLISTFLISINNQSLELPQLKYTRETKAVNNLF